MFSSSKCFKETVIWFFISSMNCAFCSKGQLKFPNLFPLFGRITLFIRETRIDKWSEEREARNLFHKPLQNIWYEKIIFFLLWWFFYWESYLILTKCVFDLIHYCCNKNWLIHKHWHQCEHLNPKFLNLLNKENLFVR